MGISVTNIAKNSLKFTSIQAIATVISLPINIYVATILVPKEYGTYGFLGLWLQYAGLVSPGLTSAGYREVPVLLGRGDDKKATRLQNVSITSDILYSVLPLVVILVASFFYTDPVLKIGLIIAAISFGISRFVSYWQGVNFLRQNFNAAAVGRFLSSVAVPLLTVALINWLRVYALLIAPIGAAVISGIYFWRKGPINFRFTFDWKETFRLVKIGVILQAGTLVVWGFRLADRTVIASALPLEQLGLYVYAMGFVTLLLSALEDFGNVLQPIMYKEAGKADSVYEGFKDTKRIAVYMALGSAILIPLSQLGFHLLVTLINTKYISSIPIINVLSYNLYLFSLMIIPTQILTSSIVNKQRIFLLAYSVGLAINVAFSILVVKLGYGVVGVAWVTVCAQGLMSFILYGFVKGYLFTGIKEFIGFLFRILVPFIVTIPFYFLHNYLGSSTISFTGISLAAQVIIWGLVIVIFYRDYFSIKNIKALIKEISLPIRNKLPGKMKEGS